MHFDNHDYKTKRERHLNGILLLAKIQYGYMGISPVIYPPSYSKLNYPVMAQLFIQLFAIVSVIIHHCSTRTAEVSAFSPGTTLKLNSTTNISFICINMMSAKQRADSSKNISPQPATISFLMSDCSSHRVMSLLIVNF